MDKLDPSGGIIEVRREDRKDLFEKLILFLGFTINEAQEKSAEKVVRKQRKKEGMEDESQA